MIFTLTLNGALDKIIFIDKLRKNHNNRSKGIMWDIGGKATHVSVVLSSMGIENIATGILAGRTGEKVQELLENKNVNCDYVWQDGDETRESYVVVPEQEEGSYMITERGFYISNETYEKMKNKLSSLVSEGDIVVFAGGPPQGIDTDKYIELLETVKRKKAKFVVDVSKEYLKESIKVNPYLIKPNEAEFRELIGKDVDSEEEYIEEIRRLNEMGVEIVALSLGAKGSIISTKDKMLRIYPPEINEVNDTGCGDVFLGGAVAMISQGKSLEEIFNFATAISASKATKEGSSDFDLNQTKDFQKKVTMKLL